MADSTTRSEYIAKLKTLAKQRGIDYRTPPFPPGDVREYLRLALLEALEADAGHPLDRTSPAARAAALQAWNDGDERAQRVALVPWEITRRIGRTVYRWAGEAPPIDRTARAIDAWARRSSRRATDLEYVLFFATKGPTLTQPEALAVVLVDFREELVEPEALRDAIRETIVRRYRAKYSTARAFALCLERGRKALATGGKVSRRKPRSRAEKSPLA